MTATLGSRDDSLLKLGDFGHERGLIAHRCGHSPEKPGDFASGLNEAIDIIHEKEHFALKGVSQIFGISQRGQAHAKSHTGRFIHLSEDEQRLGHDSGIGHLMPKLVSLSDPFAHAREYRDPVMERRDRMHELHDENRFTDTCATEEPGFSSPDKGTKRSMTLMPVSSRSRLAEDSCSGIGGLKTLRNPSGARGCTPIQRLAKNIQ